MNFLKDDRPLKVVIIYLIFGLLWIIFSDKFISGISKNAEMLSTLQSLKGIAFIGFTAIILFLLISAYYTKITDSVNQYELIFTSNPNPMWICDINSYQFLSVNQAAIDLYKFSKEEFLSMSLKDIRPIEEVDKMKKHFSQLDKNTSKMGNWIHQKKTGELLIMEIMSFNFYFKERDCRLIFARDITDKIKAEQKLEQANIELKEKIERIQSYAFANSHKVRAPLANLIGLVDVLENEHKPELIDMLKTSALSLDHEVNQMNEILTDHSKLNVKN
ncbi:MAG: PAS domain S-box protein [Bacteroidia bacterium]